MLEDLPDYIIERLRRPVPSGCHVVPNSTPVLSFGKASTARVATLGLNPSRNEFLDKGGGELTGSCRRFETLTSLGVHDLASASDPVLHRVVDTCHSYFEADRNPYRQWFNQLEPVLQSVDASYYDGTACHLDIVQWATDPIWGRIRDRQVQERLLEADAGFLRAQLMQNQYDLLLINGAGATSQFERVMNALLEQVDRLTVDDTSTSSTLSVGQGPTGTRVISWSVNIQSSPGVSNKLRSVLARHVGEIVGEWGSE